MAAAVTITLDADMLSKVDALAVQTQRSRDVIVGQALQSFLDLEAWHLEQIEAGIAEADRGEFVSDEELARIVSGQDAVR